ncbi:MAG: KUP/HAK/KT family potassium transporter [Verrucomicrobia bacterium]|nr:KUP/HAK/KT family potassium transporter [Cytophagales bacterium]
MNTLSNPDSHSFDKLTYAGVLVSIGIVFGDIGTSPLYTYKAILEERPITELLALGGVSAIFWTLTFQTTIKYIFITLRADNNGEGGIFSLYALIRRYAKWLLFPAIIGGSFLLADSLITPPISVSSAIEGLLPLYPDLPVIPIVLSIIVFLFLIQRAGTSVIGNLFGPVMLVWFSMIGILGVGGILRDPTVLKAINPYYAYLMLTQEPSGFWLLGGVFLCTTGAEALYSDLGHCGRKNIQISWIYVKICLVLNYFGQSAWLMGHLGKPLETVSPFFGLVPDWFLIPGIIIATLATIIASQALISGSFTLINEAMRLNLWLKMRVIFPSNQRGQLYIPAINWLLMLGCCGVVLFFKESKNMEAAFGLSVTLTMLMTTILLSFYLHTKHVNKWLVFLLLAVFLTIEGAFLVANLVKFMNGGWVTVLIGSVIFGVMYVWFEAHGIKGRLNEFTAIEPKLPMLVELSNDKEVPKYATNLVYLTSSQDSNQIESKTLYSIFQKQPKRADNYWFIHIDVQDEPYTMKYKVDILCKEDVYWITFKLGFREAPRINYLFRKVVEELVKEGEVNIQSRYASLEKHNVVGDFRFVVVERFLSVENDLPLRENLLMKAYFLLKELSLPDEKAYGLDFSSVTIEKAPLVLRVPQNMALERIV